MKTTYDAIADSYDKIFNGDNPYYGPISRREREVFDSWVPLADDPREALDIGCGTGFHTRWLTEKGYKTVGIDISSEMLRVAGSKSSRWPNPPQLLQCDALELDGAPLRSKHFDVIICLGSTLNHISDWELFSSLVSDRLRQGGRFVFSYDNFLGIDSLIWLLKSRNSGYEAEERGQNFLANLRCLVAGEAFHNHWKMRVGNLDVEIPLIYRTSSILRKYLSRFDLDVRRLSGVHLLSCLNRRVLEASSSLERYKGRRTPRRLGHMCQGLERWLSSHVHFACANTVGVAVKK